MKLDSNGYGPSIMPEPEDTHGMVRHEIYYGRKSRSISKAHGLWLWLHPQAHAELHKNAGRGIYAELKKECQRIFEQKHSRVFGAYREELSWSLEREK